MDPRVAGPRTSDPSPTRARARVVLAAVLDTAVIVVFAAVGRQTHEHGTAAGQVLTTAWPFLAGALLGWLLVRGRVWPVRSGVLIWACAWAVGMGLRSLTGGGTAWAFVAVAALVLSVLPGWRLIALGVTRLRRASGRPG